MRAFSKISPEWWDYTTLDRSILDEAAKITIDTLKSFERPGFKINIYDTLQEFYCAEALEDIKAWKRQRPPNRRAICGPIGPTEQLPLVAQMVNEMDLSLKNATSGAWTSGSSTAKPRTSISRSDSRKPIWISASAESVPNS